MSTIFTVEHHATVDGNTASSAPKTDRPEGWSRRQSVGFILIAALASWILVLSPFFLLG